MATYRNSYKKEEDHTLWELHEIRNNLRKLFKGKTIEEINKSALEKYSNWPTTTCTKKGGSGSRKATK